jgi:hypothetical protein
MRTLMTLVIEFSPTDGPEDGGKLLIQTNPLKQVHIVDMSVSKLLTVEGLVLLHLLSGVDGDVIAFHNLRNVIVCKITARPHDPRAVMARRMKTAMNLAIYYHWSGS